MGDAAAMTLARNHARLVSLGLLFFVLAWDLWALVVDQRPSGSDTFNQSAYHLHKLVMTGERGVDWVNLLGPKGPLATVLATLLLLLIDKAPLAMRLVSVLAHGALVLQSYDLGRHLTGRRGAGLLGAALCATHPMVFGWGRLAFHEALLSVLVLAALQLMLRVRLDRLRPALLLGVVLGLGVLTKLAFVVYMVAPGLWFVARRGPRGRAALGRLAAMLITLAAVVTPWLVAIGEDLLSYSRMAAHQEHGVLDKIGAYLSLPGVGPLLLAALAACALLWRWREVDRWELALLGGYLLVTCGLLFVVIDVWSRDLVPLLPVAAVLVGAAAHRLLRLLAGARWLTAAGGALVGALLVLFVVLNLVGVGGPRREAHAGMVTPERRPYLGFQRAMTALSRFGPAVLMVHDSPEAMAYTEGIEDLWRFRGLHSLQMNLAWARQELRHPAGVISVILVRRRPELPLDPARSRLWPPDPPGMSILANEQDRPAWLAAQTRRRRLLTATDPDGTQYIAYRVGGP